MAKSLLLPEGSIGHMNGSGILYGMTSKATDMAAIREKQDLMLGRSTLIV
ncbi:hypothetical protein [Aeromonas allosaccharophila]